MGGDAVRWGLCATLVAAAHAFALFALAAPNPTVDSDAGSPVVMLELSPVSAAPAPVPDEPQAEAQPDAQPAPDQPTVQEAAPPPAPTPSPPPPAPNPVALDQRPPPLRANPEDASTPPLPPPPPAPVSTADLAVAPPPPVPPPEKEPPPPPAMEPPPVVAAPPPPSLPPSAPSVAASAPTEVATAASAAPGRDEETSPAAAIRTWQRELIAQIERHKRFPEAARGRSGVARVAFTIDRAGGLTGVRIAQSSGSPELDAAAIDLIRSAQPFPAPPSGLGEKQLSFVAPVRYLAPSASR